MTPNAESVQPVKTDGSPTFLFGSVFNTLPKKLRSWASLHKNADFSFYWTMRISEILCQSSHMTIIHSYDCPFRRGTCVPACQSPTLYTKSGYFHLLTCLVSRSIRLWTPITQRKIPGFVYNVCRGRKKHT